MTGLETLLATLRQRALALGYDSPKELVSESPMTLKWLRAFCEERKLDPRELIDHWHFTARHNQMTPEGDWRIWFLCTGKAVGKNRVLSEFAHMKAAKHPGAAAFAAARTVADVFKTVIHDSESGILATQKPSNPCRVVSHPHPRVQWKNGSYAEIHTSEEPDRARGGNALWGIGDEIATWKRKKDEEGNTTFDNLNAKLRSGLTGATGVQAQMALATTPRATEFIRTLYADGLEGGMECGETRLMVDTIYANRANLDDPYINSLAKRYKGTHLWEQEMLGHLLENIEGAILNAQMLEDSRVETLDQCPRFSRIVVGVDPAVTSKKKSDRSGINVTGLGLDGEVYSLADRTLKASPENVTRAIVDAYWEFDHLGDGPSLVVPETNNGGDYLTREFDHYPAEQRPRVAGVWASKSKGMRFKDICGWWERGEGHFVGREQKELESQYCGFTMDGLWVGDGSPDNADAAVHAQRELLLGNEVDWDELLEANRA